MSYYEFEYEAPIERLPIGNGQKNSLLSSCHIA